MVVTEQWEETVSRESPNFYSLLEFGLLAA